VSVAGDVVIERGCAALTAGDDPVNAEPTAAANPAWPTRAG